MSSEVTAAPEDRRVTRTRVEELLIVLVLSLLGSAAYSIIRLVRAPVAGVIVESVSQSPSLAVHLTNFVVGVAPVALVLHLVRREGQRPADIGLGRDRLDDDLIRAIGLAVIVGTVGLGIYAWSILNGYNRFVLPVPPRGEWWTIPVLVLASMRAGLVEEIVGVGYLFTRLERLRWGTVAIVTSGALLRAAYHAYQGWGSMVGNLLLGFFFGAVWMRTRRTWPLVIAHVLIDVVAGVGYLVARGRLTFIPG